MRIAAAQTRPRVGDIQQNVDRHLELIRLAAVHRCDLVVFPELSLTGYEPRRAFELAIDEDDKVLKTFQDASDKDSITVVAGAPTKCAKLPYLSALIFQPNRAARVYSKQSLHADEVPYFRAGDTTDSLISRDPVVALAICFELSVPQHSEAAFILGASVYAASVAKTATGTTSAGKRLAEIAKKHSAVVLMSNSLGIQDSHNCAGSSAAWGRQGNLLACLDSTTEAVLIVDDVTEETATVELS